MYITNYEALLLQEAREVGLNTTNLKERYCQSQPDMYPRDFGERTFCDWLSEQIIEKRKQMDKSKMNTMIYTCKSCGHVEFRHIDYCPKCESGDIKTRKAGPDKMEGMNK
jgi:hypothetical protein